MQPIAAKIACTVKKTQNNSVRNILDFIKMMKSSALISFFSLKGTVLGDTYCDMILSLAYRESWNSVKSPKVKNVVRDALKVLR